MNIIKKIYICWFNSFYKLIKSSAINVLSDARAITMMSVFELVLAADILACYFLYTKKFIQIGNVLFIIIPIAIVEAIFKHYFFYNKNKWINYVSEFENIESKKQWRILIIIWVLNIVFVILSFIIFFKFTKIEWTN